METIRRTRGKTTDGVLLICLGVVCLCINDAIAKTLDRALPAGTDPLPAQYDCPALCHPTGVEPRRPPGAPIPAASSPSTARHSLDRRGDALLHRSRHSRPCRSHHPDLCRPGLRDGDHCDLPQGTGRSRPLVLCAVGICRCDDCGASRWRNLPDGLAVPAGNSSALCSSDDQRPLG